MTSIIKPPIPEGGTYQILTAPDFRMLVEQKIPGLELMQEYDASRGAGTGDDSGWKDDSRP